MQVQSSIIVNAPIERTFEVFSDIAQAEGRIEGITKIEFLSEVTAGLGTRWRETRVMLGREATEDMEISAFAPNHSYEVVAESRGVKYHTVYTFTAQGEATTVDMTFSGTPVSLVAKLMTPLGMLMKGAVRKAMHADMEALKRVAEADA